jgi:putative endonuclease
MSIPRKKPEVITPHLVTGQYGETIAADYLTAKGWRIAARNWREGRSEIDIIAWTPEDILVFVEVKTRTGEGQGYGGPEEAVDARKQDQMMRAAGSYMESIDYGWEIRFDVLAVILGKGKVAEIRHVEDAFFPM